MPSLDEHRCSFGPDCLTFISSINKVLLLWETRILFRIFYQKDQYNRAKPEHNLHSNFYVPICSIGSVYNQ